MLRAEDSEQSSAFISSYLKSVLKSALGCKYRIQDSMGLTVHLVHPIQDINKQFYTIH